MRANHILLSVNGEKLPVPSTYDPSSRLIDVIRSESKFKGPKVGCGEGGCGACTVIVDRLDPVTGDINRVTLNSCLAPVGSLDGAAVTTAEGLGNSKTGFSPAQEALATRFGSQCGYCSPGMVVAMTAAAAAAGDDDGTDTPEAIAAAIAAGIDGNLCRCTGWRPIVDACRDIADMEDLHKHTCSNKSSSSSGSSSLHDYSSSPPSPGSSSSSSSKTTASAAANLTPPEATYPDWLRQYVISKHRRQQQQQQQQCWLSWPGSSLISSSIGGSGQMWLQPGSLPELAAVLRQASAEGHCPQLVAGNTGSGVYGDLWPHAAATVIDLAAVRDLKCVTHQQQGVMLGAMVTIQQLIHILRSTTEPHTTDRVFTCCNSNMQAGHAALHEQHDSSSSGSSSPATVGVDEHHQCSEGGVCSRVRAPSSTREGWSALADHIQRIAGVHVRSAATLGGHLALCTKKPLITDLGLLLAAAGAHVQIMTIKTTRAQAGLSVAGLHADDHAQSSHSWLGLQQQQQQQHYELHWVSVEEYLESSCIGSSSSSSSSSSSGSTNCCFEVTADAVAGAQMIDGQAAAYHDAGGNSRKQGINHAVAAAGGGGDDDDGVITHQVITAVWLPYMIDSSERFWSYKVALRHVNSHALVNAACWFRFEQSTTRRNNRQSSSSSSSGGNNESDLQQQLLAQSDHSFAGCKIVSARVFVGFSPDEGGQQQRSSSTCGSSSSDRQDQLRSVAEESWRLCRVSGVEAAITGRVIDLKVLSNAVRELNNHLSASPAYLNPNGFQAQTLQGVIFKALVPLLNPSTTTNPRVQRLLLLPKPYDAGVLPEGRQVFPGGGDQSHDVVPVHLPVEKDAVRLQASGEAEYAADVAARTRGRLVYLAGVKSSEALAAVEHIDTAAAAAVAGVVGVITAADIPGQNKVFDAPLLADGKVDYVGQLVALVAATSQAAAERAAAAVAVTYKPLPDQQPIITIDQAIAAGSFHDDLPQMHAHAVRQQQSTILTSSSSSSSDIGSVTSPTSHKSNTNARAPSLVSINKSTFSTPLSPRSPSDYVMMTVDDVIAAAPCRISGARYSLPPQQHMYMEPPTAVVEPLEDGCFRITSSTQSLDAVQQAVAAVLDTPLNKITVVAKRLGGAFGGKVSRSMFVAAAAALAAAHFHQPVCYSLSRHDDLSLNHGRCLGQVTYDVGFDQSGKVHAVKAQVIYRAGAYLDLASNDGASLVAASDSAYDLSGLSVDVRYARCNIPPHTIVRAPGFLQGVMVMEQVMEHVAAVLRKDSAAVKEANFLPDQQSNSSYHNTTPSSNSSNSTITSNMGRLCIGSAAAAAAGQHEVEGASAAQQQQQQQPHEAGITTILGRFISSSSYTLPLLWQQLLTSSNYQSRLSAVHQYNSQHAWSKRGIVVTPIRFDCSPAAVSAAVSIYADGSVLVTHGGVEMGQGLTTKVKQAAVAALSHLLPADQRPLPLSLIRAAASSSAVVPNGGPTWSSTGSEGNCQAVMSAAEKLVKRLKPCLKVESDAESTWRGTIASLYSDAVGFAPANLMLSAYGFFDGSIKQGDSKQVVQYSAFGAAVTEVELDVLTGERRVLSAHIKYDCGYPLNPAIDLGQIEGGFVMGLGVMLSEEVVIDDITGATLTASTWKYKIPTIDLIPQRFIVEFGDWPNPRGILSSKASGEPAVMASTSALMALQQAAAAAAVEVQGLGAQGMVRQHLDSDNSSAAKGSGGGGDFCVLAAPATPHKLKGVIGGFDLADALDAAQCSDWLNG